MTTKPNVYVITDLDNTGYSLPGFEEFDLWARMNVNLWNYITGICIQNGYDENHRMKMIAVSLAEQVDTLTKEIMEIRERSVNPSVVHRHIGS
jgi:hypothetical protein